MRITKLMKFTFSILLFSTFIIPVFAHAPIRESVDTQQDNISSQLSDPTQQSIAAYGRLSEPGEIDVFTFSVREDATIPIEVLVPVRISNDFFHPVATLFSTEGYTEIQAPDLNNREVFFEPFSQEKLYHGIEVLVDVKAGQSYRIELFDPNDQVGDYSLGLGTVENFENQSFTTLLKEVLLIKLGIIGGIQIPWFEIIGLFAVIAGFVIGLGAVTVIDLHGLLARTSSYWTQATIRTHKITKPMIWIGICLIIAGMMLLYSSIGWTGLVPLQSLIICMLVLNGIFLSFVVSPFLLKREQQNKDTHLLPQRLQRKITVSFLISFFGWWTLLATFVWYLLILR